MGSFLLIIYHAKFWFCQGLYSRSGRMYCHKILQSLKGARLVFKLSLSLWNLSAAEMPVKFQSDTLRTSRYFAVKTSARLVNEGPEKSHLAHRWPWWRHQMETFSALLTLCAGNSPATGELPTQRPVTRGFGVFFHLCLNQRLSKQPWGWWFGTPSRSLWRHCYVKAKKDTNEKSVCFFQVEHL